MVDVVIVILNEPKFDAWLRHLSWKFTLMTP